MPTLYASGAPIVATAMPEINLDPLPYTERLEQRNPAAIRRVVIHCTELPDLATAREYGERVHYEASGTGNSGHFYIDRDGTIHQWVPIERVAHHVRDNNHDSIGIELVNRGRYPDWLDSRCQDMTEAYPDAQIRALVMLLQHLETELPGLAAIAGHDELDTRRVPASNEPEVTVRRKLDPGPLFPWRQVLAEIRLDRVPRDRSGPSQASEP